MALVVSLRLHICVGVLQIVVLGIFGTGVASYMSSRVGRKPVLMFLLLCTMIDHLVILTVQSANGWQQFAAFGLIAIVETIGNENTTIFLVSMYIVDITEAEQRSGPIHTVFDYLRSNLSMIGLLL